MTSHRPTNSSGSRPTHSLGHLDTSRIIKDLKKEVSEKRLPINLFLIGPPDEGFETQEREEKIVLFLRPHWAVTVKWLALTLLFVLLPPLVSPTLSPIVYDLLGRFWGGMLILWYLFALTYFIRSFLSWYYDVYFVTDERIVSIEFKNMMSKQISDTKIDRIQDISLSQTGFFQSILNYGDVLVQTAAEQTLFVFNSVPNPKQVIEVLQKLILQEEEEHYSRLRGDGHA